MPQEGSSWSTLWTWHSSETPIHPWIDQVIILPRFSCWPCQSPTKWPPGCEPFSSENNIWPPLETKKESALLTDHLCRCPHWSLCRQRHYWTKPHSQPWSIPLPCGASCGLRTVDCGLQVLRSFEPSSKGERLLCPQLTQYKKLQPPLSLHIWLIFLDWSCTRGLYLYNSATTARQSKSTTSSFSNPGTPSKTRRGCLASAWSVGKGPLTKCTSNNRSYNLFHNMKQITRRSLESAAASWTSSRNTGVTSPTQLPWRFIQWAPKVWLPTRQTGCAAKGLGQCAWPKFLRPKPSPNMCPARLRKRQTIYILACKERRIAYVV